MYIWMLPCKAAWAVIVLSFHAAGGRIFFNQLEYSFNFPYNKRPEDSKLLRVYISYPSFNYYHYYFYYYYYQYNNYEDLAVNLEMNYVYSEYVNGIGYGIDVPRVLLKTENDTATTVDFKLDASDQLFETCYSPLNEKFEFVPLDIVVEFNSNQGLLANHTFALIATFYDSTTDERFPHLEKSVNVTVTVGPGNALTALLY